MTQNVKRLVLSLLDGFGQHISSRILLIDGGYPIKLWRWSSDPEWDRFRGFTRLHWTVSLRMLEMTSALLEMKECDLNAIDATGNTAIAWAARGGHTDILKKLLEQINVNPDSADKDGRTPLLWAVSEGHEEAVKLLLERKDADFGLTPNARIPAASGTPLITRILIDCLVISVSICFFVFLSWIIPSWPTILLSSHR